MEDKDFSTLALCVSCLFGSSDIGAHGAWYNSAANGWRSRRSEDRTCTDTVLCNLNVGSIGDGFPVPNLEGFDESLDKAILGAVFAALWFVGVVSAALSAYWGEALMTLSAVAASTLIVWYAWKSKSVS